PAAAAPRAAPPDLRTPADPGSDAPCDREWLLPLARNPSSAAAHQPLAPTPAPASADHHAAHDATWKPHIPPSHPAGQYNPHRPRPAPVCCLRHQQFCRVGRAPLPQLGEEPLFRPEGLPTTPRGRSQTCQKTNRPCRLLAGCRATRNAGGNALGGEIKEEASAAGRRRGTFAPKGIPTRRPVLLRTSALSQGGSRTFHCPRSRK